MGIICPAFTGQFSAFGYQAFAGLCSAVQTMLNSELSSVGIAEVTLTPENYTETLSGLKETLNGMISENCLSKIFSKAVEEKVTAAIGKIDDLQAQLDDFQTFYDGVAAYTGGVDSAATGAAALRDGVNTLHQNTAVLKDATGQLNSKTGELADGAKPPGIHYRCRGGFVRFGWFPTVDKTP